MSGVRSTAVAVWLVAALVAAACSGDDGGEGATASTTSATSAEPTTTADGPSGSFTTLTYNVAGLPQGINPDQFPEQHQPLISPLLNDYDVVLLQEDFGFYTDLLRSEVDHQFLSEPHPGPQTLNPIGRAEASVGDGLNVLSRLPIGELERVPWTTCAPASADCLALKGFAATTLTLDDGVDIGLYTLHVEAGGDAEDDAAREKDLEELADHLEAAGDGAVIIGGDWNLRYRDEPDRTQLAGFVEATGLRDVCDVVECGENDDVIDRFFFRGGDDVTLEPTTHRFERDRFVNGEGAPLSDHDPLAVSWSWTSE